MKKAIISLLVLSLILSLAPIPAFADASDTEPPVLVEAFAKKATFEKGDGVSENVELVLKFYEPGTLDLSEFSVCLSLLNSEAPNSTDVYIDQGNKTISGATITDVTSEYYPDNPDYCAVLVSCPIATSLTSNFMSGTYRLIYLLAKDLAGNYLTCGMSNSGNGDGILPLAEFDVVNPGVDLRGPVLRSFSLTSGEVQDGGDIQLQLSAFDPDGVSKIELGFYNISGAQCPTPPRWSVDITDLPDGSGITTIQKTLTLPGGLPPGEYRMQGFRIYDSLGNINFDSWYHRIYPDLDNYLFTVVNSGYTEHTPPTVAEFLISKPSVKPGEEVTFRMRLEENGSAMQDGCMIRLMYRFGASGQAQAAGVGMTKGSDGYYEGTYQVPINWTPREITFGLLLFYEDYGDYQPYFPIAGSELNPKLSINSVFSGLDDLSVLVGSTVDLLSGVTADNDPEGDMTDRITIANPPDFSVPGVYFVRYEVDSALPEGNATYVGYRWVGVTEVLPETPTDAFVVAEDEMAVDATSNDVAVEADINNAGFRSVPLSNTYTREGAYRLTKLAGTAATAMASPPKQLMCYVVGDVSKKYTIAFHANGGVGTMARVTLVYGVARTLPANAFRKTGYIFSGWARSSTGPVVYRDRSSVKNLATSGTVTLYAKWVIRGPSSCAAKPYTYNSVRLTWGTVSGVSGYQVYRATSSAGTYSLVYTATSPSVSSFTNTGLATNTTYYYKVRAYKSGSVKEYSGWSTVSAARPVLGKSTITSATPLSYSSIKITWGAVAGASGYELSRATSSGGTYRVLTTTTGRSYTNTGVTTGTAYYYRVRAYRLVGSARAYGPYSVVKSARTVLAVPPSVKAVRASATSIKITWSLVAGASGYEVFRYVPSSGAYSIIKATTARDYTNTGLRTGTTYYYKVRAYRLIGSVKVYSAFSAVVRAMP